MVTNVKFRSNFNVFKKETLTASPVVEVKPAFYCLNLFISIGANQFCFLTKL